MQINAIIEHDQDGFFAYFPSLKGCVSQGDTLESALNFFSYEFNLFIPTCASNLLPGNVK